MTLRAYRTEASKADDERDEPLVKLFAEAEMSRSVAGSLRVFTLSDDTFDALAEEPEEPLSTLHVSVANADTDRIADKCAKLRRTKRLRKDW